MSEPVNGAAPPPPPEEGILIGSLYVEFLAHGREIRPRMLGHIPNSAAAVIGELVEKLGANLKGRGSRIIPPRIVLPE